MTFRPREKLPGVCKTCTQIERRRGLAHATLLVRYRYDFSHRRSALTVQLSQAQVDIHPLLSKLKNLRNSSYTYLNMQIYEFIPTFPYRLLQNFLISHF